MARRLARDGSFWFETRNPKVQPWLSWEPEHAKDPVSLPNGGTVRVIHKLDSVEGEFVTFSESYEFARSAPELSSKTTLRFLELDQIERLAEEAGLSIRSIFGNWTGAELTDASPEIIVELVHVS